MDYLVNIASIFLAGRASFCNHVINFLKGCVNVLETTGSVIKTLRFGIKSLLAGTWNLIEFIFNGSIFEYLFNGFNDLQLYVGFAGATFIASIFVVILVRICIGFVFRMFKLNVDYKTMKTKRNS